MKKLNISPSLRKLYPEVANVLIEFNAQTDIARNALGNIKRETDKIIGKNLKKINSQLDILGIN